MPPHFPPFAPTFLHFAHPLCAHCLRAYTRTRAHARALCAHASQRNSLTFFYDFVQGVLFFRKFRLGYCVCKKVVQPLTQRKRNNLLKPQTMNTFKSNLERLALLEKYVPTFLKEKEFAFADLRPLIITAQDIEDNEYTAEEIAEFVARGARELSKVEKRAAKLGY